MTNELESIIDSPVDIKRLIRKLKFSLDDLEGAALAQPGLRLEAGRFRAQIGLKSASMKRQLTRIIGKKSLKIRRREDRTTESAIKNALSLDDEVQKAQKEFDTLEVYETFTKDLVDAYTERSMAINMLTRIRASEINSNIAAVKGADEVNKINKRARHIRDRYNSLED